MPVRSAFDVVLHLWTTEQLERILPLCPRKKEKREVYAVRRHDGSLCTQKRPKTHHVKLYIPCLFACKTIACTCLWLLSAVAVCHPTWHRQCHTKHVLLKACNVSTCTSWLIRSGMHLIQEQCLKVALTIWADSINDICLCGLWYWIDLWLACADAQMQHSFVRKFLARQPSLPFSKTKKLLGMKPTPEQKKRIAERLGAGPMQGLTNAAGSVGGSKRKRNSHPGRRQQGTSVSSIALLSADDIPITAVYMYQLGL